MQETKVEGVCGALRKKGSDKNLTVGVEDLDVGSVDGELEDSIDRSAAERVSEEEVRAYEGLFSADDDLPYWQSSQQAWSPANARDLDLLSARRPNSQEGPIKPLQKENANFITSADRSFDSQGSPCHTGARKHQASNRSPSWLRESIVRDIKFLEDLEDEATAATTKEDLVEETRRINLAHSNSRSPEEMVTAKDSGKTGCAGDKDAQVDIIRLSPEPKLTYDIAEDDQECFRVPSSASAKHSPQMLTPKHPLGRSTPSVASSAETAVHDEVSSQKTCGEEGSSQPGSARSSTSAPGSGSGVRTAVVPLPFLAKRGASDSKLLGKTAAGLPRGASEARAGGAVRSVAMVGAMRQAALTGGVASRPLLQARNGPLAAAATAGRGGGGPTAELMVPGVRYRAGVTNEVLRAGKAQQPAAPAAETLKVRMLELHIGPSPIEKPPVAGGRSTVTSRPPHHHPAEPRQPASRQGAAPYRPRLVAR